MAEATIDSIKIEISASSDAAAENIKKLSEALKELKTSTSGGVRGLSTIKKQLEGLKTALSGADNSGTKLSKIARGLKALSEVQKSSGLSSTLNAMAKLPNILTPNMDGADKKLSKIAKGLNALSSVQKASGLNSTLNALGKLPDISSKLAPMDMDKFAQSIKKAAAALSPLATEMEKVSKGFAAFPIRIQKIIQSNSGLTASNKKAADSFNSVGKFSLKSIANLTLFGFGINAVADVLSGFITNINAYVENMNLFSVSMGEYYSEAMEYAELVQSKLGIDISEWTRNQGIFMSMAKGFGLANDQAYNLSKGLTELSYDISSFFNISLDAVGDGAFAKVQSGISGELEPLRRLGYALDEATLQQVAYDHGVNQSIRTMTQAQKAILRYTAIVEQSARMGVIGDMAKTLESPANALRILHMEFKSLSRAIGSIFIPALVKIIPVVQAVVEVLTEFAQALAKLFGFKMTDWSYSDWEGMGNAIDFGAGAADDMADGMSDAAAAAKKLKDYTLGIDELNIIKPDTGAGASGGSGAAGGAGWEKDWDLDSVWDKSVLENITRQVDGLKEKIKDILVPIGLVTGAFLAWKIAPYLLVGLRTVYELLGLILGRQLVVSAVTSKFLAILKSLAVFAGFAGAAVAIYGVIDAFQSGNVTWANTAMILGGVAAAAIALGIAINPLVGAITLVVGGVAAFVTAIHDMLTGEVTPQNITLALGGVAAAAIGVGLAFGPIPALIVAIVGAIATVGVIIYKNWDNIVAWTQEKWGQFQEIISNTIENVKIFITEKIPEILRNIVQWFSELPGKIGYQLGFVIGRISRWALDMIVSVKEEVPKIINAIIQFFIELPSKIYNAILEFKNYVVQWIEKTKIWFSESLPQVISGVVEFFAELPTKIYVAISQLKQKIMDIGAFILQGIIDGIMGVPGAIADFCRGFLEGVQDGFQINSPSKLFRDEVGVYLGEGIAEGMIQSTPAITAAAQGIADSVQKVFNGISYDPGTNYMALINAAKESGDFEEAARLETIRNAKIDGEGLNWEKTFDFTGVTDQFQQVADQFSVQTDAMNTDYSEFVIQTKTSTESIKTDVLVSIETVDTALKTFITQTTNNFRTMAKQSNAQIQSIISALNAIPRNITTVHTIVTRSVSGGSGSTKGYASGGFPDTGELFLAREAGPELVGQIGKRTAVANNAQIVEGIRYGVADANAEQNALLQEQNELLRAILNKSGVYLDGKQLKKSVDKASRSSGANILIGGVV